MLDDFKNIQKVPYKILTNAVSNNKISHAYIIESNGYSQTLDFVISLAKYFLCPFHYSNNINCKNCNQCRNIDNNDFLELKIINSSGMWIKKESMDELQEIFSRKSIIGNKKVYIINEAEKLNISSSNSILKFLEEPSDGIIAILITESINQLLPTIVSRCQVISLKSNNISGSRDTIKIIGQYLKNSEYDLNNFLEKGSEFITNVVEFIKYYEKNKYDAIVYINKLWHQFFKDKTEIYDAFTIMILFYKDVLNNILEIPLNVFFEYSDDVKIIASYNTKNIVMKKINVIMELRELIKYNINNNLLIDKLIINIKGCEEE